MAELQPVLDEDGEPSWLDPETNDLYFMEEEDQKRVLAAIEAEEVGVKEPGEAGDDPWSVHGEYLLQQEKKFGRPLVNSELDRYGKAVIDAGGEFPGDDAEWAYDLDTREGRTEYLNERLEGESVADQSESGGTSND